MLILQLNFEYQKQREILLLIILMKLIILGLCAAEQVIYFRMYEHQKLKELKKLQQLKQYV